MFLRYCVPIVAVHLLAFAVFVPAFFSWTAVVLCVVGVHVFGQTITLGYHRLLTHRSFKTPRWFERVLVVGALCCLEDSPARWVATHRMHHAHSDEQEDPHSPMVTFLWGHVWWLFVRNHSLHHPANYERYARDVLADPLYMWIEKHSTSPLWVYGTQIVLYAAVAFAAALLWTDAAGAANFAAGVVVWGRPPPHGACLAYHLEREQPHPHFRLPQPQHQREQPQQLVGRALRLRRGLAQQSPLRPRLLHRAPPMVGD